MVSIVSDENEEDIKFENNENKLKQNKGEKV